MKKILTMILMVLAAVMIAGCQTGTNTATNDTEKTETKDVVEKSLKEVLGKNIKYTADYTLTAEGTTQTITQVTNLPKFVMITKDGRSIFDGTNFIACSQVQGSWQCFKMTAETPQAVDMNEKVLSGSVTSTFQGVCSDAGETGLKYKVVSEGSESTVCYTTDGILLEMTTQGATMVATKVSRTVDESLFVPPADPKDLASMMPSGYSY